MTGMRGRPKGSVAQSTNARTRQNWLDQPLEELPPAPAKRLGKAGRDYYERVGNQLIEDKILAKRDLEALLLLAEAYELSEDKDIRPAQRFKMKKEIITSMKNFGLTPNSRQRVQASKKANVADRIPKSLEIKPRESA